MVKFCATLEGNDSPKFWFLLEENVNPGEFVKWIMQGGSGAIGCEVPVSLIEEGSPGYSGNMWGWNESIVYSFVDGGGTQCYESVPVEDYEEFLKAQSAAQ